MKCSILKFVRTLILLFLLALILIIFLLTWKPRKKVYYVPPQPVVGDQKFFVNGPKCQMPYVDPFLADIVKIYKPYESVNCSNESNLITVLFDDKKKQYVLHINYDVADQLNNTKHDKLMCFYRKIVHGPLPEDYNGVTHLIHFTQDYRVPLDVDALLVECRSTNMSYPLQTDLFSFVKYQPPPPKINGPRKPSVIMYGIGSMSRINLRRTMPMVYRYMKRQGWYEMQGYNKVDDNTFPNILALLSGHSAETEKSVCDTDKKGCLDRFPFIWKDFKSAGYLTAYAEDESESNPKPGFIKKPTDYYFGPLLKAFKKELNSTAKYCLGRRLTNSYIFDYCHQFMKRFVIERPIWGMFLSKHFTQDDVFMASGMQHKILNDLTDFERNEAFNHTIMIFFSDHGARFGPLLDSEKGFLEERLPMMFIYLPPWFRKQYPQYAMALAQNQNRLSSNYDIYNTLKHIIDIGNDLLQGFPQSTSAACPLCQSLFYPLPKERSCTDAGITEAYCTCNVYVPIKPAPWTRHISEKVIDHIKSYLIEQNLVRDCLNLTLKTVYQTDMKVDFFEQDPPIDPDANYYTVRFDVYEEYAMFQATVLYNKITKNVQVHVPHISRLNSYRNHSSCVKGVNRKFCICHLDQIFPNDSNDSSE